MKTKLILIRILEWIPILGLFTIPYSFHMLYMFLTNRNEFCEILKIYKPIIMIERFNIPYGIWHGIIIGQIIIM